MDPVLLRINLLLLLVIAFLPFPTKLIAESIHHSAEESVFVTFYGLTLLAIRLLAFPTAAVVLYLAVAVFLIVPFGEIPRLFSRESN